MEADCESLVSILVYPASRLSLRFPAENNQEAVLTNVLPLLLDNFSISSAFHDCTALLVSMLTRMPPPNQSTESFDSPDPSTLPSVTRRVSFQPTTPPTLVQADTTSPPLEQSTSRTMSSTLASDPSSSAESSSGPRRRAPRNVTLDTNALNDSATGGAGPGTMGDRRNTSDSMRTSGSRRGIGDPNVGVLRRMTTGLFTPPRRIGQAPTYGASLKAAVLCSWL